MVPQRLRADWQQEWAAELEHRERMLADWDHLDRRNKFDLLRRSTSAFWEAEDKEHDEKFLSRPVRSRILLGIVTELGAPNFLKWVSLYARRLSRSSSARLLRSSWDTRNGHQIPLPRFILPLAGSDEDGEWKV